MKIETTTVDELTKARAIYGVSCKAYCGAAGSPGYEERKREWNQSKKIVGLAVRDAAPADVKAFAKVKANGSHKAGHSFQPTEGTLLYESMEHERLSYLHTARTILSSGTRADGQEYEYGADKTLDSYILRAIKQDGLAREPLPSHPIQVESPILSLNDNMEWKADRAAAVRWLAWRNRSIQYFRNEVKTEVIEQMQAPAKAEKKAKVK